MIFLNSELKEKNEALEEQKRNLQARIGKLEKIQGANNEKIARLRKENQVLREKVDTLETNMHKQKETNKRLAKKIESLKSFRDYFANRCAEPSTDEYAITYNLMSSMDSYYRNLENKDKYTSELQTTVYDLFFGILSNLKDLKITTVLDAGCGLGILTKRLVKQFEGAKIFGFDFSAAAIQKARENSEDIVFFQHDIYKSLEENYSLIICTETLEHLLEPEKALLTLLEALSPDFGVLFLTVPDGRLDCSMKHINFWSPESWKNFVRRYAGKNYYRTGLIQHPKVKRLRYNWAVLSSIENAKGLEAAFKNTIAL